MTTINIKRVYQDADGLPGDGLRVFVDRLWPRGESKDKFHYDIWAKDISPSTDLREWFHADPQNRWEEFERRYTDELKNNPAVAELEKQLAGHPKVTLLYSARDTLHNNAVVLQKYLLNVLK